MSAMDGPRSIGRWPLAGCSRRFFLVAAAWGLAAGIASADLEYQVIDLGTLGGTNSAALGINDRSQAVGWSQDSNGWTQAFVWQNGAMTGLGFLPGGTNSVANAINGQGQITGYSHVSATNMHAYAYVSNGLVDLGTLGGPNSTGRGINDLGEVTGSSGQTADIHNHTFVWSNGGLIHVAPYHHFYSCDAYGINGEGRACGITALWASNDRWWAYVWHDDNENGIDDSGEMKVLGSLGTIYSVGSQSAAAAINDVGQVAGWSCTTNVLVPKHAILVTSSNGQWKIPAGSPDPSNSLMRDLGVLGGPTNSSWARSINNRSWVVGCADMPTGTNQAFLWRNGVMLNLNDLIDPASGWVLTDARGINDHNEIVGIGLLNGQSRAFLLRQGGRITDIEPMGWTETVVTTNELDEIVTQDVFHVESHVIRWAGIWTTNADVSAVFTVEYCDLLHPGHWIPFAPTSQWPIAENFWTNRDFGNGKMGFFRVRAGEEGGELSPPTRRSGTPPSPREPARRSIRRPDRPPAAAARRAP